MVWKAVDANDFLKIGLIAFEKLKHTVHSNYSYVKILRNIF